MKLIELKLNELPARDGRVVGGALDGRSTDIDATLGVHAEGVAALALKQFNHFNSIEFKFNLNHFKL